MKMLLQEIQSMSIAPRLITDTNIENIEKILSEKEKEISQI